ncbi:MAG: hypothetical protein J0M37_10335 [Ignavibacteria bacterium]|nr:hypothetical protein [Ignavibacteria bacterium]
MQFIYFIRPHKENFAETMTEEEGNIMGVHFEYLKDLLDKGKLILAGPETTGKFGIAVIEAESEDEASNIMMNDPAVKSGIVSPELYPYRVSLIRAK